ncbi:hypothetical protein VTG60DRAFT_3285 [Thermothelomyces hinnuleus]
MLLNEPGVDASRDGACHSPCLCETSLNCDESRPASSISRILDLRGSSAFETITCGPTKERRSELLWAERGLRSPSRDRVDQRYG